LSGKWRQLGLAFLGLHVLAIALLSFFSPFWVFNSVFMLGIFWYAGALAAHLYLTRRPRISGLSLLFTWIVFLALKATPHFVGLNLLKQAVWGLVCALGILWVLHYENNRAALGTRRSTRILCRIGIFSYSLYAVHTPVIMLASWGLLHLGVHSYIVQLIATLTVSLLTTLAVHFGIERVFYRPRASTVISETAPYANTASTSSVGSG
jgi:peptidoglycan/LPS O-acetylase OafA/YrhL